MDIVRYKIVDASTTAWMADVIINASIEDAVTKAYVDGSLALRDSSIDELYGMAETQDPSIADLYTEIDNLPQDASIPYLYDYTLDLSTRLDNFTPGQDASINELFSITDGQEASINVLFDRPVADVTKAYVDGSLGSRDSSLTHLFDYKADTSTLNTAIAEIDGSLNILFDRPIPDVTKAYVDASLKITTEDSSFYGSKDWFEDTQMAGRIFGGVITENSDGTVDVSAGYGIVHTISAGVSAYADDPGLTSPMEYVTWDDTLGLVLEDNAYNFIYYDYETKTIKATTDFYSIDYTREFTLGRAYRVGNNVVARLCGTNVWNFDRRVQLFGEEYLPIVRASGVVLGDYGSRRISVTGGVLWAELVNRFTTTAFDSSAGTFITYYRNGSSWTETAGQTQINNTQYDDGSGTLQTLSNNRYGVHWVYVVHNSTVHVVYGQGNYTLSEAQAAAPPATLPGLLDSYATLSGKVIILKDATEIHSIQSAFDKVFVTAGVQNHNDLSNIQGGTSGEYYHITATQSGDWVGKAYVDGSLNAKQNIIPDGTFLKESSLGAGLVWNAGLLDVSVEGVSSLSLLTDVSLTDISTGQLLIFDPSANLNKWKNTTPVDISSLTLEASLYFVSGKGLLGDVSIGGIGAAQDGSALVYKAGGFWTYGIAGGGAGDVTKVYVDGSLALRDASITALFARPVPDVTKAYVDGSLATKLGTDASISRLSDVSTAGVATGNLLSYKANNHWEPIAPVDISSLTLEASLYFYTQEAIDASFALKSAVDSSFGLFYTKTAVDASFALKNTSIVEVSTGYTVQEVDNNKIIQADASLTVTLPNNLSNGFQLTIVNASTGFVTIDASTILSAGSYKIIKRQYVGASAVHKGSGTWFVWGGLE